MSKMILMVRKDTAVEALSHLDDFQDKMDQFIEKHPSYSYETNLKKLEGYWELIVKVNKDEQKHIETT